jgi:hypothetical protein
LENFKDNLSSVKDNLTFITKRKEKEKEKVVKDNDKK